MKITSISIYKIEIPMVTSFRTGFGNITTKPTVITKVETKEGIVGWGEAAALPYPMYNPESVDTCILVIKNYLAPIILNNSFSTMEELNRLLIPVRENYIAKTGLETAFWMIESSKKNKSLSALLGGTRDKIEVGESIGIKNSVAETLEEISLRLSQGFRRIKVKIKPGWDIKLVKSIRNKYPDIALMVDANSSYTLNDLPLLQKLDNYNLIMIEQPLGDDDIVDHAVLQHQLKTPICLDESILTVEDARRAISLGSCKIINIKPGRVGGLSATRKICEYCQSKSVRVWIGGMLEVGIGQAYKIAAASMENCSYPGDLSPISFYYKDDLLKESPKVDDRGCITVPQRPGLGYEIDESKIKYYTRAKIDLK
jgi:o-succinylbenzoate synthase